MKTSNPLAAALLLIAASAAAQPLATGFSMTGANSSSNPFALQLAPGSAPVDEMVFKCGTVPYVACTTAQTNLREAVRTSKKCPEPAIPACVDFLMKQSNSTNPAETIAAYNPPPGTQWASPDCTHIPCRLADSPAAPAASGQTLAGRSYEDEPGFIGPPSPFRNQGPQPFADESSFKQAMKDQEAVTPGKVIDLGNNTYAVDTGDGNYSIGGLCSGAPCNGLPKPADQIPGLADALQAANSLNSGGKSLNNDNPNGFTASSNKQTPSMNNAGQTGDQGQADDTNPSDEAKGMGRQAAADSVAVSGASGSSGGTSVASNGSPSSGGATPEQVIKTKAAALGSIEITYTRLQQTEDSIKGAAGAFNNGQMTGFASPNAPASGRLAEPPVDEKYLGKIQASSNE
ncbi:MAG: hypothetical protein HYX59_10545 [Elusimicrobia bacterium]|nr:hypothetical protein [Elusimicrobiota bacterium]